MNNKNVIITGASRGIGRATALLLAGKGYNLVLNSSKSTEALLDVRREISRYPVQCEIYTGNVGSYTEAQKLFSHAQNTLGSIGILINNAGISHIGLLQDMLPEEWDHLISTNLTSVFNMSKLVIPDMIREHSGKIINISSVWGICGASCETAYSAAKGGVNAFTRSLGKELAPSNIQVNAIACGAVDTAMNSCFTAQEHAALCEEIPSGRMASPAEVAEMIFHLINAPAYLTGEVIKMDGGWI